mmetsp:Transcript_107347/g.303498  ORF Transcript_107347/g.303498 Transcript_107347/m.303498 type:complete len:306 (-) Transcript_107347:2291-3208(-)
MVAVANVAGARRRILAIGRRACGDVLCDGAPQVAAPASVGVQLRVQLLLVRKRDGRGRDVRGDRAPQVAVLAGVGVCSPFLLRFLLFELGDLPRQSLLVVLRPADRDALAGLQDIPQVLVGQHELRVQLDGSHVERLLGVLAAFQQHGPSSLHAQYAAQVGVRGGERRVESDSLQVELLLVVLAACHCDDLFLAEVFCEIDVACSIGRILLYLLDHCLPLGLRPLRAAVLPRGRQAAGVGRAEDGPRRRLWRREGRDALYDSVGQGRGVAHVKVRVLAVRELQAARVAGSAEALAGGLRRRREDT